MDADGARAGARALARGGVQLDRSPPRGSGLLGSGWRRRRRGRPGAVETAQPLLAASTVAVKIDSLTSPTRPWSTACLNRGSEQAVRDAAADVLRLARGAADAHPRVTVTMVDGRTRVIAAIADDPVFGR